MQIKLWLSIIIPAYNVEKYIKKCLFSIVNQFSLEEEGIEVIVIDDGSTDSSGAIADSFAERYSFIRVLHRKNTGVAAARNTGMEAAEGEWLYFMDSDDWLEEEGIASLYTCIGEYSDADIILFDAFKDTENTETKWEHLNRAAIWQSDRDLKRLQRGTLYFPSADLKMKVPLAAPWDKIYRNAFVKQHRLSFREELKVLDDMVFNMEAFGAASKVVYCKKQIYHYRQVSDSVTNSYKPDRIEQDMKVWNCIRKYMLTEFACEGWTQNSREEFLQAYYCRIIKSFSICCRLCFFSEQNENILKEKIEYLKRALSLELYREAFQKVKLRNAEWKLKLVILLGRLGAGYGIYLLHVADTWEKKVEIRLQRIIT